MRFKVILLGLVVLSLLLVGCAQIEENNEKTKVYTDFLEFGDVNAEWNEGIVTFEATVMKPTPCHELSYNYFTYLTYSYGKVTERSVEIVITQSSSADVCAQVITEEIIKDSFRIVEFSEKPTLITFVLQSN